MSGFEEYWCQLIYVNKCGYLLFNDAILLHPPNSV